jgi:hypothetical protein
MLSEPNNYKNYLRLEGPSFGHILETACLTIDRREEYYHAVSDFAKGKWCS